MVAGMEVVQVNTCGFIFGKKTDTSFQVRVTEHALFLTGKCPVDLWTQISRYAQRTYGFDLIDLGIGIVMTEQTHPDPTFVFTNEVGTNAMRAEVDRQTEGLPPLERWCRGWDRGISSMTIVCLLRTYADGARQMRMHGGTGIPHDADDFGRCVRLLDAVPDIKPELPQLAERMPEWAPIVADWDRLEGWYRDGSKKALKLLYEFLSNCTDAQ